MRILLLHLDETDHTALRRTFVLVRELGRTAGLEVALVCATGGFLHREAQAAGVSVIPVRGWGAGLCALWSLLREVRRHDLVLLHCCDLRSAGLAHKLRVLAGQRCRVVQTWRIPGGEPDAASLRACRMADAVVCHGEAGCGRLERAGVPRAHLYGVMPAVDAGHFAMRRPRGDGRYVFVVSAPLVSSSGHVVVFDAMRILMDQPDLPPWEVRLVGDGPDFATLLAAARERGVASRLAMLGAQDVRRILPDADAMLVPNIEGEDGAEAIRSAWCVGLPVLASSLDVHEGMVRHGATGLLAPLGDFRAFASGMARLMREGASLSVELTAGGADQARQHAPARMATEHVNIYREVEGESRRARQAGRTGRATVRDD